ncbi:hypothetical protein BGX28_006745 [Mortierella sp. GBA30]|nr:hypothetical protein BGX28_006745 [Mortierella sp. GBA30]
MTSAPANTPAPATNEGAVASHEVGMMFVHEYYTFLNKEPSRLHCFYNKQSTMSHGVQGEEPHNIHSKILDLDFEDCKVLVSNVDSQSSLNGGIMIQVLGEMSNRGGASQKFVQTFFLAEQPRGYYVLNDIFRYLKDDNEVEAETLVEERQPEHKNEAVAEPEPAAATATTTTDAQPETVVVEDKPTPVTAAVVDTPAADTVEPVAEKKTETEEKKVAVIPTEEKKPAEKKTEHKKYDKKERKDNKKDNRKETESVEKLKSSESSKKQPNGTPAAASTTEATAEASKTPVAAPEAVPAEPPKPKTWANLAANNSNQWGSHASAAKGSSVNVTPVSTPKPQSPTPNSQQNNKPVERRPNSNNNTREEMLQIYVKNITEKMSLDQLREAFSKFGSVKNVELTHKKNCAYIDFTTTEAVQAALKQNKVIVGSETVLAEERRPRNSSGFQNGGRPFYANNNGPHGHHQGFQGAHRGGRGPSRGGFQDRKPIQRPEKAAPTVAVN